MSAVLSVSTQLLVFLVLLTLIFAPCSFSATTWNGVLRDAVGKPVADARIVCVEAPVSERMKPGRRRTAHLYSRESRQERIRWRLRRRGRPGRRRSRL